MNESGGDDRNMNYLVKIYEAPKHISMEHRVYESMRMLLPAVIQLQKDKEKYCIYEIGECIIDES